MKALSQSEYGELRGLYESIYTPKETEISEEELTSILEEIALELLDEGYDIEEIEESFDDEFVEEIIIEAKVTYGSDTESPKERRARAKAKVGEKKAAARKAAVKSGVEKAKAAPGKALRAAARGTEKAEKEVSRRAGNVATRAKAGATRAAMKATGVSAMDVPTKSGARKRPDTFVAGRKSDRDSAKAVIKKKVSDNVKAGKAKLAGAATNVAMAGSAAKAAASDAKDRAKKAVSDTKKGIKRGIKDLIRKGAEKVAAKASGVAKRMSEEVETYDVVIEFLCDQGIAENLQEAQEIMVNQIDSEDIATILEAYKG